MDDIMKYIYIYIVNQNPTILNFLKNSLVNSPTTWLGESHVLEQPQKNGFIHKCIGFP